MVEESCVGLGTGQRWMVGENVLDLRGAMFGSFLIYIQGFHVGLPRGERNKHGIAGRVLLCLSVTSCMSMFACFASPFFH